MWPLVIIPAIIFAGVLIAQQTIKFTMKHSGSWWSFPLYMAVVFPIFMGGIILIIICGFMAFTGHPLPMKAC